MQLLQIVLQVQSKSLVPFDKDLRTLPRPISVMMDPLRNQASLGAVRFLGHSILPA